MRLRTMRWINTDTLKEFWGIQVSFESRKWINVSRDGEPWFFDTEAEAKVGIKEFKSSRHKSGVPLK